MKYEAIKESQHGCCFDYSVIDTSKPVMIGDKHFDNRFETVCECFDQESAELIACALNKTNVVS